MNTKKVTQEILGFGSPSSTSTPSVHIPDDASSPNGLKEISPLHADDIQKLYEEEKGFHMFTPKRSLKDKNSIKYGGSKDKSRFVKGTGKFIKSVIAYGTVVFTLVGIQSMLSSV